MKYSELEKIIKAVGCEFVGNSDHPLWKNPKTGVIFKMSHHKSQEVKKGTLNAILKAAGVK